MRQFILTLLLLITAGSVTAAPIAYSVNSNGVDSGTSDSLYKIDLANGETTRIEKVRLNEPRLNSDIEGLAFASDGGLYGVDDADETLLRISTTSGLGESVSGNPFNLKIPSGSNYDFGLTFTCQGILLMASDNNQILYLLNSDDGSATPIGTASLNAPITALAAWGTKVYGLGQGSADNQPLNPNLYEIDITTGNSTLVGPLGGAAKLYANAGMAFDLSGQLWAITDRFNINNQDRPSQILKIDTATGKAEAIAETSVIGFESLAISGPGGCSAATSNIASIPTLSGFSAIFMILLLLLVGGFSIRNQV